MVIFLNNIDILNEMYKVVTMGIVGIDEVKDKILCRELKDIIVAEKKVYQKYKLDISKLLNKESETPKEINMFVKMFNEMYTDIKLIKDDDKKIVKMMIEGMNKGILKLNGFKNNDMDNLNKDEQKILLGLLDELEEQINKMKPYLVSIYSLNK